MPPQSQQEEHEDLQYASVQFSRNQADPVYSNFIPVQHHRHEKEQEEDLEYTTVKFSGRTAPRSAALHTLTLSLLSDENSERFLFEQHHHCCMS